MLRKILLSAVTLMGLLGCSTTKLLDPYAFNQQALKATESYKGSLAQGSPEEKAAIQRFKDFFAVFDPGRVREKVRATYAEDAYFNDTLRSFHGLKELEPYLVHSAELTESCTVDSLDVLSHDGEYYFRWAMHIRFKKFKKGQVHDSIGITHVRFNKEGKVVFHQDYWDAASYFFEKVPLLGGGIRAVKRRL